jgi:RNA polymerase sigma-70 factor (ECF subfamily)
VGWSAAEVAGLLETSVPAVHSALQRARATLGQAGPTAGMSARSLPAQEQDVLRRFMLAWQRRDLAGLAALMAEDAVLEMPPQSLRYLGREQVARFFGAVPADGRLDRIRAGGHARANGQPALAAYVPAADGASRAYGVMVVVVVEDRIQAIHRLPGQLAVPGLWPASDPHLRPGAATCHPLVGTSGRRCSMRVLRLPSTIGSMPAIAG